MSNPLYYQWLDLIAQRDQAMLFIALTVFTTVGAWLSLRSILPDRRIIVFVGLGLYYASLLAVIMQ